MTEAAATPQAPGAGPMTPMAPMTQDQKQKAAQNRANHTRQRQGLELQRERILSQRTSNPGRRQALEAALAQIEAEIAKLG